MSIRVCATLRHPRERDQQHVRSRSCVDDVIDHTRPLEESLTRGIGRDLALAGDRLEDGQCALLDDDDRPTRMRVPTGRSTRDDSDLLHHDVGARLERDRPLGLIITSGEQDAGEARRRGRGNVPAVPGTSTGLNVSARSGARDSSARNPATAWSCYRPVISARLLAERS